MARSVRSTVGGAPVRRQGGSFVGYYDICPWSPDMCFHVWLVPGDESRHPVFGESAQLGITELASGRERLLGESAAWNWQQGCRAGWLDGRRLFFNDYRDGGYRLVVVDIETGNEVVRRHPSYCVAPGGESYVSVDFVRIGRWRDGYGYPAPAPGVAGGADAALTVVDIASDYTIVAVEWADLDRIDSDVPNRGAESWIEHAEFSPDGRLVSCFRRWRRHGTDPWFVTRLLVLDVVSGRVIAPLPGTNVSHYTWIGPSEIVAWAYHSGGADFYRVDVSGTQPPVPLARGRLPGNGHCSYAAVNRLLLTDDYPSQRDGQHSVYLYDPATDDLRDVVTLRTQPPPAHDRDLRCDFHARWAPDGRAISLDTNCGGHRATWIYDVGATVDEMASVRHNA
jgi:hypothetical protein